MIDNAKKAELKKKYGDEKVFVVPYNIVENIEDKFSKRKHDIGIWTKYNNLGNYVYRYDAEGNNSLIQLIPYIVLFNETSSKVFVSKRVSGEDRLIGSYSLGFGGHINECDGDTQPLFSCAFRELYEEVDVHFKTKLSFVGTVRNKASNLSDHLGIVFFSNIDEKHASIKEKESLIGEWMSIEELFDNYGKFEDWAKFIIDYLYENRSS